MKELHILIVGHACFPNMGSEAGVTWNWAWHLAERNRVWVIAHGFACPLVEQYMHDHPQAGYSFATTQQWKNRALLMEQLYRQVLARRGGPKLLRDRLPGRRRLSRAFPWALNFSSREHHGRSSIRAW